MTDTDINLLGPVDYLVVEFPAGAEQLHRRDGERIAALVDAGTIRVIDILILTKNADGTVDVMELSDIPNLGELQTIEAELAELLAADDVEHLAAAMDPGSTAGVLIWENTWAAAFASAARRSGGQLIANGRIPIQAIIASIEADPDYDTANTTAKENEMPLRPARIGRVGVIGHPVAKTAWSPRPSRQDPARSPGRQDRAGRSRGHSRARPPSLLVE